MTPETNITDDVLAEFADPRGPFFPDEDPIDIFEDELDEVDLDDVNVYDPETDLIISKD